MNDNIFTAENWPDYDEWLGQLRKELAVRGVAVPSQRELGVALFHGGIDILAGKLCRSNQLGWACNPAVIAKAAAWISDHLPQVVAQQKRWESEIRAGNRSVFQVISIGSLRARAEVPLADVLAAAAENRFHVWRFDVLRTTIYNLDFLLTEEVEKWALETGVRVTHERVKGAVSL